MRCKTTKVLGKKHAVACTRGVDAVAQDVLYRDRVVLRLRILCGSLTL